MVVKWARYSYLIPRLVSLFLPTPAALMRTPSDCGSEVKLWFKSSCILSFPVLQPSNLELGLDFESIETQKSKSRLEFDSSF